VLNRIRGPFNLSTPALAAGAAAMEDVAHIERSIDHNDQWVSWLSGQLTDLGLEVTPSVANFILVSFDETGAKTAANADAYLINDGIIVRRMESYGLPNSLRITIGTQAENEAVVKSLSQFVKQAG
jgi:histidinol-phosphate aminotransferase